jgi:hypothetical protein
MFEKGYVFACRFSIKERLFVALAELTSINFSAMEGTPRRASDSSSNFWPLGSCVSSGRLLCNLDRGCYRLIIISGIV